MAKRNPYKNLDIDSLKRELLVNIEYLSSININALDDDIEIVTLATGSVAPSIVSSIEQKLDEYIMLIKDSIDQLNHITYIEQEVSEFVEKLIDKLEKLVLDLEEYFHRRPPGSTKLREHRIEMKSKRKGTYYVRKIAANIPTQNKNRSKILKIILQLKPIIQQIREMKEDEKLLKGNKEFPFSMMDFMNINRN